MTRLPLAFLLALLLASAASGHWADVKFRDLKAEPLGDGRHNLSVYAVNTEGTTNSNNVSFEIQWREAPQYECPQHLSLRPFEKRLLTCEARLDPGDYSIVFQSERLKYPVLPGATPAATPPPIPAATPAPATPTPT
ncbi:MAG: hypothetical protein HY558_03480, partial [Euryarchaeota archaeon]|nr:hypothetical protein [Euryarchaeota archaeon]